MNVRTPLSGTLKKPIVQIDRKEMPFSFIMKASVSDFSQASERDPIRVQERSQK